jgi:hypothetical protein
MKVLTMRPIEDCFDGSSIRELTLDVPVTRELVTVLGAGGTIQYFADFPRPLFRVRVEGRYDIKGIAGESTIRVHLKHPERFSWEGFANLPGLNC